MLLPLISPWIENTDYLSRMVSGGDVRSLVPVAKNTRIGKVAEAGRTTVFAADYMINLVWKSHNSLINETVFATSPSPLNHESPGSFCYVTRHYAGSGVLVLSPSE